MSEKKTIMGEIRERLSGLCSHREHAYKAIMDAGHPIPNYKAKVEAINKIRTHLAHFEHASEKANINLVHALENDIQEILPQDTSNPRVTKFRQRILAMVQWCNEQFASDQQTLLNNSNLTQQI